MATIKEFENFIMQSVVSIINNIIKDNPHLDIQVRSRWWAEISDFLEKKFVEYTANSEYFIDSESAPEENTKNPRDARTFFNLWDWIKEEIRLDFKALKTTKTDSNPDIWTPNKVINFINQWCFYILYVYVYYEEDGDWLKFVQHNWKYVKSYFLKDISRKFRSNPKPQLQVNMEDEPEYRSREEFIQIFIKKCREWFDRQLEIIAKKQRVLDRIEKILYASNKKSEEKLEEIIKDKDFSNSTNS